MSGINSIPLTDPDETFYSLTAKEMLNHDSLITPLIFEKPQFEKPPLFYWALMMSFQWFGISPWSARLIPVICGIMGVVMTFLFCRRVFGDEIARLSAIVLGASAIYLAMSKVVLTDIMLTVCMMGAFYAFFLWVLEGKQILLNAFAVMAALAVLTKGPVAIIVLMTTVIIYLIVVKEYSLLKDFILNRWVWVFLLVCAPWYIAIIYKHGWAFINEFIIHDNLDRIAMAEHKKFDTWYFYPMIMLVGLFPFSFYLMLLGRRLNEFRKECLFLVIWIVVTFVVFQKAHSKLASYILPVFPAWSLLLSVALSSVTTKLRRYKVCALLYAFLGAGLCVALVIGQKMYPQFIWLWGVVAVLGLAVSLIGSACFLWRAKVFPAVLIKALGMLWLVVCGSLLVPSTIARMTSDAYLKEIVRQNVYLNLPIVTSKLYARGVYFYTGNPVVVMDNNKQPFWSPHPIEVISNLDEINSFFSARKQILCVIRKNSKEDLDRIFQNTRTNFVLAQDAQKIVVLSEKRE